MVLDFCPCYPAPVIVVSEGVGARGIEYWLGAAEHSN